MKIRHSSLRAESAGIGPCLDALKAWVPWWILGAGACLAGLLVVTVFVSRVFA